MRQALVVVSLVTGFLGGVGLPGLHASDPPSPGAEATAAEAAARLLSGTFHATATGALPSARYESCALRFPSLGARVLYVEATATGARAPFFQRVWVVEDRAPVGERATVREFRLARPEALQGACRAPSSVRLTLSDVTEREGCAVSLQRVSEGLAGRTESTRCESAVNDARFSLRTLTLQRGGLTLQEQGFDAQGALAWGSQGARTLARLSP